MSTMQTTKATFVELIKILSILKSGPTHKRLITHHLAINDRCFYRRINLLKSCGVTFSHDRFGRYQVQSLPAWIEQAVKNLSTTNTPTS